MADEIGKEKRLKLHELLLSIIKDYKGAVYFQPPSSIRLTYPCIMYELSDVDTVYADSIKYKNKKRWDITVIDTDPDSEIPNKILALEYCSFDRFYSADNLNHFVYSLYY